jgi:hypothetical protein
MGRGDGGCWARACACADARASERRGAAFTAHDLKRCVLVFV